ncbi:MAG TPA: type IV toxin-antitoxin system AbiEi family antitoxin domain-containing protein, partial [Egibacteraceae bacterium]|nr:type IV toxin-antitoxin system AbiEi family antitoxin domain-containing protein [Egibacteraceae bacterium]
MTAQASSTASTVFSSATGRAPGTLDGVDPHVTPWAALWRLGIGQHGVFHVRQAAELGISPRTLRDRALRERLLRLQPGTVGVPGARITLLMRVSAAL